MKDFLDLLDECHMAENVSSFGPFFAVPHFFRVLPLNCFFDQLRIVFDFGTLSFLNCVLPMNFLGLLRTHLIQLVLFPGSFIKFSLEAALPLWLLEFGFFWFFQFIEFHPECLFKRGQNIPDELVIFLHAFLDELFLSTLRQNMNLEVAERSVFWVATNACLVQACHRRCSRFSSTAHDSSTRAHFRSGADTRFSQLENEKFYLRWHFNSNHQWPNCVNITFNTMNSQ